MKIKITTEMKYPEDYINKVIQCDCLEIMKHMPDKCVDLILTDPPYGIDIGNQTMGKGGGVARKIDYGVNDWDKKIPSKEVFDEIRRISKNQIIFGGNYMVSELGNSPCWIVWDKDNGETDFADCELAWTSFPTAVRKFKFKWSGMLQENMKEKEIRHHPTQKPVELMKWCLEKYSKEDQIILDPFLGSGTTAVACKQLKRNFIGIELNQKYVDIANERIKQDLLF